MDYDRRIRTDGVRDGRIMAHDRQMDYGGMQYTGAGRRVTAGGSRQRYTGRRRITEGTGRASTAGKARRRQAGGLRGTDAEETDYGRGRRQVQVDYG